MIFFFGRTNLLLSFDPLPEFAIQIFMHEPELDDGRRQIGQRRAFRIGASVLLGVDDTEHSQVKSEVRRVRSVQLLLCAGKQFLCLNCCSVEDPKEVDGGEDAGL